jgi:hypothetical protein
LSPLPYEVRDDDAIDSFDVPAAVLCARCGKADCLGCTPASEGESGVIAIVPWERPGASVMARLFATARASTIGAETFFASLPDGELPPAMRFAVLAELLAVFSMACLLAPIAALVLPNVALAVLQNPATRGLALRAIIVGVPALALWMVGAHLTHGAALDLGARRQGAPAQRRRALRFGLYSCGWDLMSGPLGAIAMLLSSGFAGMKNALEASITAPGRSTSALLQGVYRLDPARVLRARRAGMAAAIFVSILSGFAVLALVVYFAFEL